MKLSDGLFLDCARKVAARLSRDHQYDERIVDAACMHLVMHPEQFDVLLLPNLYGDIVSDLCAGLVGGLGVVPAANLGDDGVGVFEAVHGSAPDIAGQDMANPTALLLSAVLMLRHLDEDAHGRRVMTALWTRWRTARPHAPTSAARRRPRVHRTPSSAICRPAVTERANPRRPAADGGARVTGRAIFQPFDRRSDRGRARARGSRALSLGQPRPERRGSARAGDHLPRGAAHDAALRALSRARVSALSHPPQDRARRRERCDAVEAARRHRIVYASNHRSHTDYLVEPLVLDDAGIRPPIIAAGINLFGGPLGFIHKYVTGALPIRRNTKDPAYLITLKAYVGELLRKHDLFFYPGRRTQLQRRAEVEQDRLVQRRLHSDVHNLVFLPTAVAYDLVLEDHILSRQKVKRRQRPFSREIAEMVRFAVGYRSRAFVTFGRRFPSTPRSLVPAIGPRVVARGAHGHWPAVQGAADGAGGLGDAAVDRAPRPGRPGRFDARHPARRRRQPRR